MVHAIAVVGTGPVGSAAAYHLAQRGVPGVVQVDGSAGRATYLQSGGSVSWHRPDPVRSRAIEETARFIRAEVAAGAPIRIGWEGPRQERETLAHSAANPSARCRSPCETAAAPRRAGRLRDRKRVV